MVTGCFLLALIAFYGINIEVAGMCKTEAIDLMVTGDVFE